jgi:AcrR family transcriptional regulator
MGRPKKFNREGVLDRAIPVFWKHGFANTTVQHLEQATGVNKSGLYTEFKDKEDLFLASLERYVQTRGAEIRKRPINPSSQDCRAGCILVS